MAPELCLLSVHAHPDDEASKGPGTIARYHAEGVRTVLVCCTGGEEGDILNPAMDRPEIRSDLASIRAAELDEAARVIGYDEVVKLGYRDSGMPGTPANERKESFAQAPLEEAVGRLVEVMRRVRPQVVITYPEDQSGYPHPDHIRVHEITVAAWDAVGDRSAFPGAHEPWQPMKLYYNGWSSARVLAMHEKFLELGLESPFGEEWVERMSRPQPPPTTTIDVSDFADVRRLALLAHATQVDPNSRMWFGLPPEVARTIHPVDEYTLARSNLAPSANSDGNVSPVEDDLFSGIRDLATRST
ncbi:MAG TPA: mycothiol conjugate amidase Mca [Acidimicrobiales bacterium]|nr:mycothiol conjugate amidase Mca [Acidimicrobiales bacterium]